MTISVKESIMVQPAVATPGKVLWNSDLDLLVGNYHTPTVYFYNPNGTSNFFHPNILKEASVRPSFFSTHGRLRHGDDHYRLLHSNRHQSLVTTRYMHVSIISLSNLIQLTLSPSSTQPTYSFVLIKDDLEALMSPNPWCLMEG